MLGRVDTATFLARHPEWTATFRGAGGPALIANALTDAEAAVGIEVFGDAYNQAVGLYASHILASAPAGHPSRLKKDSPETVYSVAFDRLLKRSACGLRGTY